MLCLLETHHDKRLPGHSCQVGLRHHHVADGLLLVLICRKQMFARLPVLGHQAALKKGWPCSSTQRSGSGTAIACRLTFFLCALLMFSQRKLTVADEGIINGMCMGPHKMDSDISVPTPGENPYLLHKVERHKSCPNNGIFSARVCDYQMLPQNDTMHFLVLRSTDSCGCFITWANAWPQSAGASLLILQTSC